MKNIFDLVIRFMVISAMLVGMSLTMVATATEVVALESAICQTARTKNVKKFKRLLAKQSTDPNTVCVFGSEKYTLLALVIEHADVEMFNALILAGASPTMKSEPNNALTNKVELRSNLWLISHGNSPEAIHIIKTLLNNGVSPDSDMLLPSENTEVMDLFHKAGVPVNRTDDFGWTALMYAVRANSNASAVKHLISLGANVNVKSTKEYRRANPYRPIGWTPLMEAAIKRSREKVEALIAAGADPHVVDSEDNTAYDYAYGSYESFGVRSNKAEFLKWYEGMEAGWKPRQRTSKTDKSDNGGKSEDKVASPKKSESKVPSYGTAKDCTDLVKGHDPKIQSGALTILKRNNIGCYTVPNKCLDLLSSESDGTIDAMHKFLRIAEIFCYRQ